MAISYAMPVSYPSTLIDFLYEPVTLKSEPSYGNHYLSDTPNVDHYVSDTPNVDHYVSDTPNVDHYVSDTPNVDHYVSDTPNVDHYLSESPMDTYVHVLRPEIYKLRIGKNVAPVSCGGLQPLISWTTKHPQHWTNEEVLDWIYYVVDQDHLDGSRVCGEAYQCLTGKHLCHMTETDFNRIDPFCGTQFYCIFRNLLQNVSFVEPKMEADTMSLDAFNAKNGSNQLSLTRAVCSEAYLAGNSGCREGRGAGHLRHSYAYSQHKRDSSQSKLSDSNGDELVVYQMDNDMKVDLPCLGTYSISTDFEFPTTPSASQLFRSSASRLTASATFTAAPPPQPPLIEPAFENHHALSFLHAPISSSSSSSLLTSRGLMKTIPSLSPSYSPPAQSSSSSPSSKSSSSLHSRVERPSLTVARSQASSSRSSSGAPPSSTSSSFTSPSSSSSVVLSMSRNVPSASSRSTSATGRLDPADSGYVSDDPDTQPPLASTPPCPSSMYGVRTAMVGNDIITSSDGRGDGGHKKKIVKRIRSGPANKNNHLWEFVRDLLRDPKTNPKLLKWEDKENGVFRFVQSEKVAQLWGEKKNNPLMTYEKLSRAMRFCRSAGYFNSVPKNGKFPKKLCFMFGEKSRGWMD